jgi:uncharacterized ferritin-like protein (DUF455 family)
MELREFALRVLFSRTLDEKLDTPAALTDQNPGPPIAAPEVPERPSELRFKPQHSGKSNLPRARSLDQTGERGRLLHFFANHELLATELMALVLLRFPQAPPAFRRAVQQTLRDEQAHTRWYLRRMKECGVAFGEQPVSGYFWRAISGMESPLDYVAGLSLTFEQANLDFTRSFARAFAQAGDMASARLLDRIYHDEIGHVACGLKWFRKWKAPNQTDWDAYCRTLKFPLSAQRAKGPEFNVEGRLAAGLDRQFVDELNVYAQSKGRTPGVFVFNPFAEGYIAQGQAFTPNKHQQSLQRDLENLPQFLCRQDDVVLVGKRPSAAFLSGLKEAGFTLPEFVELRAGRIEPGGLTCRKLGELRPWAWGPDSLELLRPLFANACAARQEPGDYYDETKAQLYSKAWSAAFLKEALRQLHAGGAESWVCTEQEVGVAVGTLAEAMTQIDAIRQRGCHNIIIKEALGVAGHNAIRLLEPELLETQRRWITRAIKSGRRLVIEPWLERKVDFSVQLEMQSSGLSLIGYAGLSNDWKGQYQGNWAGPGFRQRICVDLPRLFPAVRDISNRVLELNQKIFRLLETELRKAGYLGPVGIDAFVYKTPHGECRLKPIVEINPRYTMGRLALELMKYVAPGSSGSFRLINRRILKNQGFNDFASWAKTSCSKFPLRREGAPVPRISEGFVCLNDPDETQACLAVFQVTRSPLPPGVS